MRLSSRVEPCYYLRRATIRQALKELQAIVSHSANTNHLNSLNQIQCLYFLGDYARAQSKADLLLNQGTSVNQIYLAIANMYLGEILASSHSYAQSIVSFENAAHLFSEAKAAAWLHEVFVRRAQVLFIIGDFEAAMKDTERVTHTGDLHVLARAHLLRASIAMSQGLLTEAQLYADEAASFVNQLGLASLQFSLSLVLAELSEQKQNYEGAKQHYNEAYEQVMHIQRDLTVDYRPLFLESTQAALRGLIHVNLHENDIEGCLDSPRKNQISRIFPAHSHASHSVKTRHFLTVRWQ